MYNIKKSLKYNCFSVCIEINLVKPFTFFSQPQKEKRSPVLPVETNLGKESETFSFYSFVPDVFLSHSWSDKDTQVTVHAVSLTHKFLNTHAHILV